MLNRTLIQGRLVKDPTVHTLDNGDVFVTFCIAHEKDVKSRKTGERESIFLDVVAWRKTGEFVAKYFVKGRNIIVDGKLDVRTYQDKEGKNRHSYEIHAENCYFGDSKGGVNAEGGVPVYGGNSQVGTAPAKAADDDFVELGEDDFGELPF